VASRDLLDAIFSSAAIPSAHLERARSHPAKAPVPAAKPKKRHKRRKFFIGFHHTKKIYRMQLFREIEGLYGGYVERNGDGCFCLRQPRVEF